MSLASYKEWESAMRVGIMSASIAAQAQAFARSYPRDTLEAGDMVDFIEKANELAELWLRASRPEGER